MDSYEKILTELVTRTQNRTVSWKQTELKNRYEIRLGTGKIAIEDNSNLEINDFGVDIYIAYFYNSRGELIARYSSSTVTSQHYKLLDSLWNAIEDAHYNRPETIDSMLKELDLQ